MTKYLADGDTTTDFTASLISVSGSIPDKCKWNFLNVLGGGIKIKSKLFGRVLYIDSTGISCNIEYPQEQVNWAWRIANVEWYGSTKYISDCGWRKFVTILQYKADWYGRNVLQIGTYYPSSQICHKCNCKNPELKNLSIRTWECPVCHEVHDRDHNASLNVFAEGERLYNTI